MRRIINIALISLLLLPATGMAEIYRWTDSSGQIHYGQTPPDEGDYERVNPAAGPSGADSGSLRSFVQDADKNRAETDKAQQKQMQAKAEKAERCAKARERISYLEQNTAHRLMVKGADGQAARMTDEQFNQQLGEAHKAEAASCS
jgi:hypothetical protein